MRFGMGRRGSSKAQSGFSKIKFDLPASVDKSFNDAIQTRLVENTTASWEYWFGLMSLFKEQNGHCNPPRGAKLQGYDISKWAQHQRGAINSNKISPQRKELLLSIGFDPSPFDSLWDKKFHKLSTYFEKHGHSNVNSRDKDRELARWVVKQRIKFREGRLTEYQINKLHTLKFELSREEFDRKSSDYLPYQEAAKIVSQKKFSSYLIFQSWARGKSPEYGEFPDNLPRSPQQVYLGSGWVDWPNFLGKSNKEEANDVVWLEMLDRYKSFVLKLGRVPMYDSPEDQKLANWIGTQRSYFKDNDLSDKRIQMLIESGFSFDPKEDSFNIAYKQLLNFVGREGHARVKQSHKEQGFNLGSWVSRIRGIRSRLSPQKIALFEALPGWVWKTGK